MPIFQLFKDGLFPKLPKIVEHYGTPFHIYDEAGIRETGRQLKAAFSTKELLLHSDGSVELIRRAESELDYFATLNFNPETLQF